MLVVVGMNLPELGIHKEYKVKKSRPTFVTAKSTRKTKRNSKLFEV